MTTSAQSDGESVKKPRPSEDELFDVLANSRRRHVLELLIEADETLDIGTLSTRIAALENGVDVKTVTSDERKRVYTALQQSHLPKLDAAGLIEFDKQRGTTAPRASLSAAEPYLTDSRTDHRWCRYYLGLAAVSAVVVVGVWSGFWPFRLLPSLVWTGTVTAAFGATAVVQQYHARSETGI